jgi:hypothetical protein
VNCINRHLGGAAVVAVLVFSASAHGQATPGSVDQFSYRCHLLGDPGACSVFEAARRGLPLPGPYATALMGKGVGRDEAMAAAAALGEHPVRVGKARQAGFDSRRAVSN